MKLFRLAKTSSRVFRVSLAAALLLLFAATLKISGAFAQEQASSETPLALQVTANDEIAASDIAGHHIHLRPVRSIGRSRAL